LDHVELDLSPGTFTKGQLASTAYDSLRHKHMHTKQSTPPAHSCRAAYRCKLQHRNSGENRSQHRPMTVTKIRRHSIPSAKMLTTCVWASLNNTQIKKRLHVAAGQAPNPAAALHIVVQHRWHSKSGFVVKKPRNVATTELEQLHRHHRQLELAWACVAHT
jgi:hypothetical protein